MRKVVLDGQMAPEMYAAGKMLVKVTEPMTRAAAAYAEGCAHHFLRDAGLSVSGLTWQTTAQPDRDEGNRQTGAGNCRAGVVIVMLS